jgi:RNA processing factor Prp31
MSRQSGLADSPLFHASPPPQQQPKPPSRSEVGPTTVEKKSEEQKKTPKKKVSSGNRDAMTPRNHETMVSRYHDTMIEIVRKAVKEFGKEAATHRFTLEEKKVIADIIYAYKGQGVRTSENEITRIAVNFIVSDYRENGENSFLDKVLRALNE